MEKRYFLGMKESMPLLGFGAMRLPVLDKSDKIDKELTKKMVRESMENGFNYFDTAYPYHGGKSETALRTALVEAYPREDFYLADKMPVWMIRKTEDFERIFNEQLDRCGVTYFDFYMLHALDKNRESEMVAKGGYTFLSELKSSGRARYVGFSFHDTADVLDDLLTAHPEVDFVQLQINYLDWESNHAKDWYHVALKHNKPIIIMEPVKGGSLANLPGDIEKLLTDVRPSQSAASWAIRFAASLEGVMTVLSGMSTLEQVQDNVATMQSFSRLTPEEYEVLDKVLIEWGKVSVVPCTACKYCVDECPKQIEIPTIFTIYNELKRSNNKFHANLMYGMLGQDHQADACINCGNCTAHCPQKIEIPEALSEVKKALQ